MWSSFCKGLDVVDNRLLKVFVSIKEECISSKLMIREKHGFIKVKEKHVLKY